MNKITFSNMAQLIATESEAYEYMESLRWPNGEVVCPHCGVLRVDHYFLKPDNGVSRKTTRGSVSERRVWKCKDCRKQFSVTTGTIFHGSKVSLRIWLFVFFEMCANKNGLAAREIARKYGVAPKTAWFMTQRIREAMKSRGVLMSGNIVADETYIGGKPENWHANDPRRAKFGNSTARKTAVVALISSETDEIRTKAVTSVTGPNIRRFIEENIMFDSSSLHTDSAGVYRTVGKEMTAHHVVNHNRGQYVTAFSDGTNKAENFFSQLKRSISGTHHSLSPEHLSRYLAEFAFRHGTHDLTDTERMVRLMGQVPGIRLSYRPLADGC